MKREAELKSLFGRELKRQAPDFIVLQYATNGAPDRSIIGNAVQTNWEFKHATPDFKSPGDQELTCCRLAHQGHCRYVVWQEVRDARRTLIVHPLQVKQRSGWALAYDAACDGFDMRWLVERVLEHHT